MLATKFKDYNVILASKSPRRQELLKTLELDFQIKTKDVEEVFPKELKKQQVTDFLAELKAKAFENDLKVNDLLITSDTIVWFKNKALGKPKDRKEAIKTLQKLSGNKHVVYTSVCLKTTEKTVVINDKTTVFFKKLKQEEIEHYVDNYNPFDKAGAYGIQEWIGYIAVKKIEGSYFNVMGFPLHKVYKALKKF